MKVSLGQGENPRVKGFFIAAPGGGITGSALTCPSFGAASNDVVMCSLLLCEGKEVLYKMIEFFTRRSFAFFSHARIQRPRCTLLPRNLLAVVAISVYCSIEFFFPFQVKAEFLGNRVDFGDCLFEPGIVFSAPPLRNGVDSFQFAKNLTSKCGSGLAELLNFSVLGVSAFSQVMVNDFSCKCSNNSTGSESDGWIKGYHANSLLFGFTIGGFLAIFVYDIFPLILSHF